MRISKEAIERKNEILDVSEKLFITKGYDKATINDILVEVGIAKGTFYYYFKSKEEVMDAIIARIVDEGVQKAKLVLADNSIPTQEKIVAIIQSFSRNEEKDIKMLEQLHQVENAMLHVRSLVQTILAIAPLLTTVVEKGIEEGIFHTPYPRESTDLILLAGQTCFDEGLFHWTEEEAIARAKAFIRMVELTLGAKEGSMMCLLNIF